VNRELFWRVITYTFMVIGMQHVLEQVLGFSIFRSGAAIMYVWSIGFAIGLAVMEQRKTREQQASIKEPNP
jgi:hypothetical protein